MKRSTIHLIGLVARSQVLLLTFLTVFNLFFLQDAIAQTPQDLIFKANQEYNEGHYEEAARIFTEVADKGLEAPELFYNLGNACFKMNDLPRAILWFERARRLDPGNENIHYNLQVANSRIADNIDPLPVLFYVRWYQDLVNILPFNSWAVLTIVGFVVTLTLILIYLVTTGIIWRKAGFWGGIVGLGFTLLTVLFSYSAWKQTHDIQEAIIFDPTITVKSSPDDDSIDLFVLHEGTKVRLLDKIGDWYEIRIANGSVGWLPERSLEEI